MFRSTAYASMGLVFYDSMVLWSYGPTNLLSPPPHPHSGLRWVGGSEGEEGLSLIYISYIYIPHPLRRGSAPSAPKRVGAVGVVGV